MDLSESKIVSYMLFTVDLYVIYYLLTQKRSIFQGIIAIIATIIVSKLLIPMIFSLIGNMKLTLLLLSILFYCPILYIFKEHWTMKLFVFSVVSFISQYVILIFAFVNEYMNRHFGLNSPPNYIYVIVVGLEMALLLYIYKHTLSSIKNVIKTFTEGNVIMSLLPSGACAILVVIYANGVFDLYTFITTIMITVILVVAFYLLNLTIRLINRKNNLENQLMIQIDHYKNLAESIQKSRIYRHDIRHHLAGIAEFFKQGDLVAAQQYLDNLYGQYSKSQVPEFCENKYIDAVLTYYFKMARKKSIKVQCQFCVPEEFGIEPLDTCVIIGNCFEHAISCCAAMEISQRQISLHGEIVCDQVVITLKNTSRHEIIRHASGLSASKQADQYNEGLGSIQLLIHKYDGTIQRSIDHGMAIMVISLKLRTTSHS